MSKRKSASRPKTNSAKGWLARRQATRRQVAEERNALYAKLTPQAKLAQLDKLNLKATKVRAKLAKQLAVAKQ